MKATITNYYKNHIEEIIAGLLGAAIFLYLYSFKVINPSYVDYLKIGGDLSQHYYGWELYRQGNFQWLIGLTNSVAHPYSTSVIFTDSIPLFAVLFKIVLHSSIKPFQYFGLWGLMCFVLQGIYAARLIKRRVKSEGLFQSVCVVLLSTLFILCPVFIRRMFWHTALAAQFVILIAIDLFDKTMEYTRLQLLERWILMGMLSASIHLYFLAMTGPILFASCVYRLIWNVKSKDRRIIDWALDFVIPIAGFLFFAWYVIFALGGFNSNMDGGAPGLGYYSFNLNGMFNADDGYSCMLPQLPYCEGGQYEGNAYLGFGVLVMVALAVIIFALSGYKKITSYTVSTWIICVIMIVLAASNKITFGEKVICEIPVSGIIEKLYSPFRSSGRLIWPVVYMVMLGVIAVIADWVARIESGDVKIKLLLNNREKFAKFVYPVATIIVCIIVGLQIYDLHDKLHNLHNDYKEEKHYVNNLYENNDVIKELIAGLEVEAGEQGHLVFLKKSSLSQEDLYAFTDIAIANNITINDFYFARNFVNEGEYFAKKYAQSGRADCVYVFKHDEMSEFADLPLYLYRVGDYMYGVAKPIK